MANVSEDIYLQAVFLTGNKPHLVTADNFSTLWGSHQLNVAGSAGPKNQFQFILANDQFQFVQQVLKAVEDPAFHNLPVKLAIYFTQFGAGEATKHLRDHVLTKEPFLYGEMFYHLGMIHAATFSSSDKLSKCKNMLSGVSTFIPVIRIEWLHISCLFISLVTCVATQATLLSYHCQAFKETGLPSALGEDL